MAEEALQIAMKRREAKSKGEKKRYTFFCFFKIYPFKYRVPKNNQER